MLKLLPFKAQVLKVVWKPFKPCQVGIYRIALAEYSKTGTHVPGFQSCFSFSTPCCICQISQQQHKG